FPDEFKRVLLWGSGETEIEFSFWRAGNVSKARRSYEGVVPHLERLYHESESEFTRNRLKAFMSPQFCDACQGQRLKLEILSVRLEEKDPLALSSNAPILRTLRAPGDRVHLDAAAESKKGPLAPALSPSEGEREM